MIALSILKHRAIIKKPAGYNTGIVPEFAIDASDVPCWIVPETERRTDTGLGRMATGRYQALFQKDVSLAPGWRLVITEPIVGKHSTEWRSVGTYDIDSVVRADTHVEAVVIKQS